MNIDRSRVFTWYISSKLKQIKMHYSHNAFNVHFTSVFHKWKHIFIFHIITKEPGQNVWLDLAFTSQNLKFSRRISNDILQVCFSTYFVSNLSFKYNSKKTAEASATMNLQPIQGWLRSNFICFIKCQQLLRPLRHMCHVSSYISAKTNRSISFWRALNVHTKLRSFAAQLCSNVKDEFQNTTSSLHQWQPAPGWRLIPWIQITLSTQLEACPLHIWH